MKKNEVATTNGLKPEDLIPMAKVQALSDYMFEVLHIMDNGKLRKMDCSEHGNPVKNDTRTAYFSKAKIDALFKANPGSDGLFIYFGVCNSKIYPLPPGLKSYENKLTVSLVATKGAKSNLLVGNAANNLIALGTPKLCPPDTNC